MKAVVYERYGGPEVLKLKEVEKPTPKDDEMLIKVYATTVNYGDLIARDFSNVSASEFNMPFLFWFPAKIAFGLKEPKMRILGNEFAGEIETVGKDVTRFKAGDPVFGYRGQRMGTYAEYVTMPEEGVVAEKPGNMSYEEATTIPYGGIMALSILRKANIQRGEKVLINGASGGIGSAAVQLAKFYFGAEVTGVCGTARMGFVKALGVDKVIDYTREDFTQNGERYDLIFDVLGRSTFSQCRNSLNENGRCVYASFKLKHLLAMLWTSLTGDKKAMCVMSSEKAEDLVFIKELVEDGKMRAVIDRVFPIAQVAEAHAYVENGNKKGQIVIKVNQE